MIMMMMIGFNEFERIAYVPDNAWHSKPSPFHFSTQLLLLSTPLNTLTRPGGYRSLHKLIKYPPSWVLIRAL